MPSKKRNTLMSDLLFNALEDVGSDGSGKGGALGAATWIARKHPKVMLRLIGRMIEMEDPSSQPPEPEGYRITSRKQLDDELRRRNLPPEVGDILVNKGRKS